MVKRFMTRFASVFLSLIMLVIHSFVFDLDVGAGEKEARFLRLREGMVKKQISNPPDYRTPVGDKRVLQAMRTVPRHLFVRQKDISHAYNDYPLSIAEEMEVMEKGSEKFTGIVGMSQWVTANTCSQLGSGSKEYELILPPVSEDESRFSHPALTPEKPSGYYLAKGIEKFGTWTPPGGFKYNPEPLVPFEELTKR